MSDDLNDYISTLKAEDRSIAREYGGMPAPEFQARLGPAVDRIIDRLDTFGERLDALSPNGKRGLRRLASIRLGDIAKGLGAVVLLALGYIARNAN